MLNYIQKLMHKSDCFTVNIRTDHYNFDRVGVVAVDQTGVIIDAYEGTYGFPWTAIRLLTIEEI